MLARDQIRVVAEEIGRSADRHLHDDDRFDRQQLWETVRRAARVIEAVANMDGEGLEGPDRTRRTRFIISELEAGLEAARKARVVQNWTGSRDLDDV